MNIFAVITSVITDDAVNMKRMGTLVDIWHITFSNSHSVNLLAKDVVNKAFAIEVNNLLNDFLKVL